MHVVLIGNTGSGKSTLAKAFREDVDLELISSGKIAQEMAEGDPSTNLALQQGAMAPEAAMRQAMRRELEAADVTQSGWMLDGFPRSVEQLICLTQWTTALPVYVYLEIEPWTCIERLAERQRIGDNPDSIARKFSFFQEKTLPMIDVLREGGVLYTLDAEEATNTLVTQLKTLLI